MYVYGIILFYKVKYLMYICIDCVYIGLVTLDLFLVCESFDS